MHAALGDEADVRARTAHVEGDETLAVDQSPRPLGAEYSGSGAGEHERHRPRSGLGHTRDATVAAHDEQVRAQAARRQGLHQPLQIQSGSRPYEGVHAGGGETLELAKLW